MPNVHTRTSIDRLHNAVKNRINGFITLQNKKMKKLTILVKNIGIDIEFSRKPPSLNLKPSAPSPHLTHPRAHSNTHHALFEISN